MEPFAENPDRNNALSQQLVNDLENLRDALTRLSLTLQDIAFDVETNAMSEVAQLTTALLVRMQTKEGSGKGGHE